jgi:hypothetical protein
MSSLPGDVAHDRGRWGHHHGGGGGDAGDIFAGLLFIGAIAAVASAASNANKTKVVEHHYVDAPPPPPPPSPARAGDWGRARSIDAAVDTCVSEIERSLGRGVDTVDGVSRDGDGWHVGGRTRSGDPYQCAIDGDGRLRSATVNGRAPIRE